MLFEFGRYKFGVTQQFPPEVPNRDAALAVWQTHESLRLMMQIGWGNLLTGMNQNIIHGDPDVQKALQLNVREMGEGLGMLYCFSVWDHHIDPLPSAVKADIEDVWMTAPEKQTYRAYKHVRHSVGHCFSGKRANRLRTEFEAQMRCSEPLSGVQWDQTKDTIDLSAGGVAISCHRFLDGLSHTIASRLLNDNRP